MKIDLLGPVSRGAVVCAVFFTISFASEAQTDSAHRWGPRAEFGGYAGDGNLSRGEIGLFFPIYQQGDVLVFGDLRGRFFDGGTDEGNAAIGYRRQVGDNVYGAWIGYDGRTSDLGNYFDQISGGIEVLNPNWEFRVNGYWPLTDRKRISSSTTESAAQAPRRADAVICRLAALHDVGQHDNQDVGRRTGVPRCGS